jgi:hypothetical protein
MPAAARPSGAPAATSRRGFLFGAVAAVLAAAGGGTAAALLRARPVQNEPGGQLPAVLLGAVEAEDRLIAAIDSVGDAKALAHLRADHVAHREALLGAAQAAGGTATGVPSSGVGSSSRTPSPALLTLTQLGNAESAAALAAAAAASKLTGADAALLASISACEASHAELLR